MIWMEARFELSSVRPKFVFELVKLVGFFSWRVGDKPPRCTVASVGGWGWEAGFQICFRMLPHTYYKLHCRHWQLGGGAGRLGFGYFLECWNPKLINYITFRGRGVLHIHVGLDIRGY